MRTTRHTSLPRRILLVSDDHEDGGPTIQLPAAAPAAPLVFYMPAVEYIRTRPANRDLPIRRQLESRRFLLVAHGRSNAPQQRFRMEEKPGCWTFAGALMETRRSDPTTFTPL